MLKRVAGALANSALFARARRLNEPNRANWHMQFSRVDNLFVSAHAILADYAAGLFPVAALGRAAVHESELQYGHALGGVSVEEFQAREMRKPFWDANAAEK